MITLSSPFVQPSQPDTIRVEHDADSDPHIATLKSVLPDFNAAVMHVDVCLSVAPTDPSDSLTILESVDNDEDCTLDVLLGMNDPTYISSAAPLPIAQPQPDPTQQDLDEQLACRLALEEKQAAGAWSADRQSRRDHQQQAGYQAYQPHSGSGRGWGSSSRGSWGSARVRPHNHRDRVDSEIPWPSFKKASIRSQNVRCISLESFIPVLIIYSYG